MVIKHKINMDLIRPGVLQRVDVVQGDQYTRQLEFTLYADGTAWTVPEEATVVVRYGRSDGSGGTYDRVNGELAWTAEENVLTVELAPSMLLQAGPVMLAVDVAKESRKISTFRLLVYVQPNVAFEEELLDSQYRVAAYLPIPDGAEVGQYLKVAQVTDKGVVTKLEAENISDGSYPGYWQTAVQGAIDKVTGAQDAGGRSCFSFAWFSDSHIAQNAKVPNPGHVGDLACAVMDACGIPFALMCGDAARSDGNALTSESQMRQSLMAADKVLKPIGWDRLLQVQGNHDGSWGYDSSLTDPYFCRQMDARELYNAIFRKLARDDRRVFGGDGSYYYLDDGEAKVRYILLNSLWVEDEEDENGYAAHRRMRTYGFGQEQLRWLAEEALDFQEEGWAVVLATHVPPLGNYRTLLRDLAVFEGILRAFCDGGTYSGTSGTEGEWDYVAVSCDFTGKAQAEIVGLFCGHAHKDQLDLTVLPFPVLTITCDGNLTYDETEETRVMGTANEHALDFVTVNRENHAVKLTRLGVGKDRMFLYGEGMSSMYAVVTVLSCCTLTNGDTAVVAGESYETEITAEEGCVLSSVTVTMAGEDITDKVYADGKITVEAVYGELVITAVAVGTAGGSNLADPASEDWAEDSRLNSSGEVVACEGSCVTNWIECEIGDVIRISGLDILDATSGYILIERTDSGLEATKCASYSDHFTVENGVISYTVHSIVSSIGEYWGGKIRFSGALTVDSAENVAITIQGSGTEDSGDSEDTETEGVNLADPASEDWASGSRLNFSCEVVTCEGSCVTNWIACEIGDVIEVSGLDILDSTSGYLVIERTDTGAEATKCASYSEHFTVENGAICYTVHSIVSGIGEYWGGRVRFSGAVIAGSEAEIVITVRGNSASEDTDSYTNLADTASGDWADDSRLNSSSEVVDCEGSCVTNWISCAGGDVIRVKGLDILDSTSGYLCYYRTDTGACESAKLSSYTEHFTTEDSGVICYTVFTISESVLEVWDGRLRFSGALTADSADEVVITVNEEI